MEQWWNDTDRRKLKYWEKAFPNATLTIRIAKWTGIGFNLGLHG
jgi:hypothetical protein